MHNSCQGLSLVSMARPDQELLEWNNVEPQSIPSHTFTLGPA